MRFPSLGNRIALSPPTFAGADQLLREGLPQVQAYLVDLTRQIEDGYGNREIHLVAVVLLAVVDRLLEDDGDGG